jgi:hypothetical protein
MDGEGRVSPSHRPRPSLAPLVAISALLGGLAWGHQPLDAQQPPEVEEATSPQEEPPVTISPRGALLRALALPGWGHAAIGSYTRGGFYFALQAATGYTFLRTRRRLGTVRDRVTFRESFLRAELAAEGVTDPATIEERLDEDAALSELRALQDGREQQQEDLIAFGIFVLFLSGADAYVSAHLSRFPEPLEVEAEPLGGGRYALGLRVRLPN